MIPKFQFGNLLSTQRRVENGQFDIDSTSSQGAVGLSQILPSTFEEHLPGGDITNPRHQVQAQANYMRWLLDRPYIDNEQEALAAYNAGPEKVKKAKKKGGKNYLKHLPEETQEYIKRNNAVSYTHLTLPTICSV